MVCKCKVSNVIMFDSSIGQSKGRYWAFNPTRSWWSSNFKLINEVFFKYFFYQNGEFTAKNNTNTFLAVNSPYVRQLDDHALAINESLKFSWKNIEKLWLWITQFYLKKNISKKKASSPWKLFNVSWLLWMGRNFDHYPGFQPKITHTRHFWPQYT